MNTKLIGTGPGGYAVEQKHSDSNSTKADYFLVPQVLLTELHVLSNIKVLCI